MDWQNTNTIMPLWAPHHRSVFCESLYKYQRKVDPPTVGSAISGYDAPVESPKWKNSILNGFLEWVEKS